MQRPEIHCPSTVDLYASWPNDIADGVIYHPRVASALLELERTLSAPQAGALPFAIWLSDSPDDQRWNLLLSDHNSVLPQAVTLSLANRVQSAVDPPDSCIDAFHMFVEVNVLFPSLCQ